MGLGSQMEMLKKLDASDNFTQLVVAVVVIASCTLVARLFDEPKKANSAESTAVAAAAAGIPVATGAMQVSIEGLPDNPPRALAGALKTAMGLEATPVVVAAGPRAVVRLATMSDFRRCSPQTARVMVSGLSACAAPFAQCACPPVYCARSGMFIVVNCKVHFQSHTAAMAIMATQLRVALGQGVEVKIC